MIEKLILNIPHPSEGFIEGGDGEYDTEELSALVKIFGGSKIQDHILETESHLAPDSLIISCYSFSEENDQAADIRIGWNNDSTRPDEAFLTDVVSIFREHGFRVLCQTECSVASPIPSCGCKSISIGLNRRIYLNGRELRADAYKVAAAINRVYGALHG